MEYLCCPSCKERMLVQDEIKLRKHDDRLGGVNIIFDNNDITTNIIYDLEIKYRCISCSEVNVFTIKNYKGLIKQGF